MEPSGLHVAPSLPEAMEKVQKECSKVVGMDNIVEEFHLPKLQYLNAVIKETLHLHPSVPLLIPRSPFHTSTLGGYTIPKGTRVLLNVWAVPRDPSIWDSPDEFEITTPYLDSWGYTIPKGTRVLLNVWAVPRDPSIWDSPDEFKPDPFLQDGGNLNFKGSNFNFIPFGSGRRMCPGLPFAERMVAYSLASFAISDSQIA